MNRAYILNIPIDILNEEQVINYIITSIENKKLINIITLNAEMFVLALKDKEFLNIITNASLIIPDGAGIVWALKRKGIKVKRLTGIDLLNSIFKISKQNNYKIMFLGAKEEIVTKAKENVIKNYPSLDIVTHNGYFTDDNLVVEFIKAKKPDILLVGLGAPKQEKWINKWQKVINVPVCIGVGGSFDVLSGHIKRAPKLIQNLALEWLYRAYKDPRRIKRLTAIPIFMFNVIFYDKI